MTAVGEAQSKPAKLRLPGFDSNQLVLAGVIFAALALSGGALWLVSESAILVASFVGGVIVLAAAIYAFVRLTAVPQSDEMAPPDWSVTVAAIEQPGMAIAITDRANRLACANRLYEDWFGNNVSPPNLKLERQSLEALTRAAREAWRDGQAEARDLVAANGTSGWHAKAERAGRGDDYLIWRLRVSAEADPAQDVAEWIGGPLGQLLSRAGIEAALVAPDGMMRAASQGFAERASGDASATLAGQEFVAQLRTDDQDQIFFAREGRKGPPQTLVQVPLDTLANDQPSAANEASSLMLLLEKGVGIGNQGESAGAAATPQLEALLGALPLGLAMTDRDGRFLFGNQAFLRAVEREEAGLPQYPSDLVVREDKSALADAVRRFGKGPASNGDMAVRLGAQPDDPVSLGLAGVRGLGEAAVLLSLTDSTEETKLKRQVAQATKMQAVGQLAGGVAHDFNNVLTAIIGYCDLMLLRHTPGDSDYDDIQQIRANSNRAASLTRQLLAFSRQQTLRPEVLQLPDVVSEVSQLLKRLLGEKITFKVRHDRDLGPVRADPQQLEQVIVNLAVNARDAIQASGDGTGQLTMATRRVTARDIQKMGTDIIPVGDYTVLVVQDTGGGVPQAVLGKIFEPFFTTKEQGKGTGLGLSTVYGIVKQSGGFIFADNIPGSANMPAGARFTIYLPVHRGEVAAAKPEAEKPASEWSGGGNVLLVEDEDMVRAVGERALTRSGYTVTTASDGEEGLAAIANRGPFDLVLSDVVMPGMDGPTMVKALRKAHPKMPIIFMSGYAEEQLRKEIDIDDMHFVPKPFSVQQISEVVGEVLAKSRG
ncbi:hybrid sensor histidine kinase/response regulator [Pontixanthobacter aquaemixtae]|uniref:histidine kinase n=1 Tax=Pontixanthobacter aquaemixtae TaxID=1958940 RepID=A0A844ZUA0_9SPHN|nr:response regulator [Pontixanthobacter aquaemixtae]MXO90566.1 response regulator [Pontixanthobacter aquaemixtae]